MQTQLRADESARGEGAEADLLLAEERVRHAESVIASCKVQMENDVADPDGDTTRSPRPSMIKLARSLAEDTAPLPWHPETESRLAEGALQKMAEGVQLELDDANADGPSTAHSRAVSRVTSVDISFYRAVLETQGKAKMSSAPSPPTQGTTVMSGLPLVGTHPSRAARYTAC